MRSHPHDLFAGWNQPHDERAASPLRLLRVEDISRMDDGYYELLPEALTSELRGRGFTYRGHQDSPGGEHVCFERYIGGFNFSRDSYAVYVRCFLVNDDGPERFTNVVIYGRTENRGEIVCENSSSVYMTHVEDILKSEEDHAGRLIDAARKAGLLPAENA